MGGTFDPPHIGHAIMANTVLDQLKLDEVRFMPNNTPPHKKKTEHVANSQRADMIQLTIRQQPKFSLELFEMENEGTSYTYDTMKLMKEREPETEFFFIIGADMIEYLPKWHKVEELEKLVQFVGVERTNHTTETPYNVILVEAPRVDLSSSLIREKVKRGESISYFVVPEVEKYIEENSLYES